MFENTTLTDDQQDTIKKLAARHGLSPDEVLQRSLDHAAKNSSRIFGESSGGPDEDRIVGYCPDCGYRFQERDVSLRSDRTDGDDLHLTVVCPRSEEYLHEQGMGESRNVYVLPLLVEEPPATVTRLVEEPTELARGGCHLIC